MIEESSGDETGFILKVQITFYNPVNMTAFREYIFEILIDNVQIEADFIIFEFKEELTVCIYAIDNFGDYSNSLTQNIYMTLMDRQEDIMEKFQVAAIIIIEVPLPTVSPSPSLTPGSTPTGEKIPDWPLPLIGTVGAVVLILALVIFCVIIVVLLRRRKIVAERKRNQLWEDTHPSMGMVRLQGEVKRPMRPSRVSFVSRGHHLLQTLSHPLSVEELGRNLAAYSKLCDEYMSIPPNMANVSDIPVGADEKNRYIDVLPNPSSRVSMFLKFGIAHSDYINANYIRGYRNQSKAYIATQGPLSHTVVDFWRMIWDQKTSVIIMTTGLVERNLEKCTQYWPDEQRYGAPKVYGDIQVTIRRRKKSEYFIITTFFVQHLQRMVNREILHYWFIGWPDHGVPISTEPVIDFLLESQRSRATFTMPGPTVVHCSAGIGRTGVFIAADIGMKQLEENMTVDVLKIVATMRQDRGGMVQTKDQYAFLHKVLYDYARRIGHVSPNLLMEDDELNEEDEYQNEDYDFDYQDDVLEMQTFKQK